MLEQKNRQDGIKHSILDLFSARYGIISFLGGFWASE